MNITLDDLILIMRQIQEYDYQKSKLVENFIQDVIEHFGEERAGA